MDNNTPAVNYYIVAAPTTKEQIITTVIGLGAAAAVIGIFATVGFVSSKVQDRIDAKANAKQESNKTTQIEL